MFSLLQHEKHEAKKDSEHSHGHKIKEEVAAAVAVGAGGFVLHEHHEKKEAKREEKEDHHGKDHHHHLFWNFGLNLCGVVCVYMCFGFVCDVWVWRAKYGKWFVK